MEILDVLFKIIDKYGMPMAVSIYLMVLHWKYEKRNSELLGILVGRKIAEEETGKEK